MILAQDVGDKAPNSMSASDPGQMFEQGRSHAERMVFMGDHDRELSSFRVFADEHVVSHTDQPVGIKRAESAEPIGRLGQPANEFLQLHRLQREEAKVAIMVGEVLMQPRDGLGIVDTEATQRHDPSVEQSGRNREFHRLVAHDPRRYSQSPRFDRGRSTPPVRHWSRAVQATTLTATGR
jgi:hypothetical protein